MLENILETKLLQPIIHSVRQKLKTCNHGTTFQNKNKKVLAATSFTTQFSRVVKLVAAKTFYFCFSTWLHVTYKTL